MAISIQYLTFFLSCIAGFTFDKMLHTTPDDAWDIILKIHVTAPFKLIRQAAPYFRVKVCITLASLEPASKNRISPIRQKIAVSLTCPLQLVSTEMSDKVCGGSMYPALALIISLISKLCRCKIGSHWFYQNHL
jgi:NAD(P)-dependent dehydrogenase (short-subunit alcohol dehydrogenase family)